MKRVTFQTLIPPIVAMLLVLAGWHLAVHYSGVNQLILPSPQSVGQKLAAQLLYLATHSAITLLEAVAGFAVGTIVAFGMAVLFDISVTARRAFYPYAIAFKAVPLVALAPLVVVWCGSGFASKVVLSAVISFFPILVNTVQGFRDVDPDARELFESMSATRWQVFVKLKLPSTLPALFAGMRVSSSFAVVGAVVAEFVGSTAGIGFVIRNASYYFETSLMFAGIVFASAVGLLFFGLIVGMERVFVPWTVSEDPSFPRNMQGVERKDIEAI